ncbi:RNA polymerase sigma factor SigB [Calidifontibacillus erzurumensis]|uniref:RNA polymerase sigma factor n=1 Tax=Calidifontibacillus erzurumensis TaxID=2741433 RepID=A0A8J8GHF9_9BACI|nr:RNA polymerase sigma factor SigB [Calidifontibacillus erzurumensis]NSL52473.1 RNA polymerase sigma factor SigB [Calidifontibacillus erzurumensis]
MITQSQPPQKNDFIYDWIKEYQDGMDKNVQAKIVDYYRNLVESLARKYSKGKGLHEDLVQVGMIGLLAAIRRYNENYGKSFEAFAIRTIEGEIKRFIRDKTWSVHVPRRIKELSPKINKAVDILTNELERFPKASEIAEYLGVTEEEIFETMEMNNSYHALSIDSQIESDVEGGQITILDMIGSLDDGFSDIDRSLLIEKVFAVLTAREKEILHYTFFLGMSQKEVGEIVGISQMHVSRIQRRALNKLREVIGVDV